MRLCRRLRLSSAEKGCAARTVPCSTPAEGFPTVGKAYHAGACDSHCVLREGTDSHDHGKSRIPTDGRHLTLAARRKRAAVIVDGRDCLSMSTVAPRSVPGGSWTGGFSAPKHCGESSGIVRPRPRRRRRLCVNGEWLMAKPRRAQGGAHETSCSPVGWQGASLPPCKHDDAVSANAQQDVNVS